MARGRKAKAGRRLIPPPGMTAAETALWDQIVDAQEPAWHIPGGEPLLLAYIDTVLRLEVYRKRRDKALVDPDCSPADIEMWEKVIGPVQNRMIRIGTALRLNPHSRQAKDGAKNRPNMPWLDFPEATD
jgi:hypothetical protein